MSNNYLRNLRFNHQSEQASESALVSRNTNETEKRLGGAGEPPILLDLGSEHALSADMLSLFESILPTEESHEKRKLFANKIEKILNDEWPGNDIKVHMFGSSMNELGTTQSDVDLCVTTQWSGLKNIFMLSNCLSKQHGMKVEQTVHKAKVPIVRLFDSKLELACDINVNNTLALHNTRLIRNYVNIDPRVRPLAMVVKHWARRRVLNDAAKGGTISTYTWTCIILNFLQMRDPPILPVLHNMPHEGVDPIVVNGEDASFYENVESLRHFGSSNKESLGGLLFAFFRRMAFEFDYDNHVISLRQGKYLTKAEKGWDTCKGWKMLCVEEPFNTTRNLGNSADDISVNGLREEFRRAYEILYRTASLDKLCEEYHFPNSYSNYNNNLYYYSRHYNNNNKRVQHKRNNNNNSNKTNGTWSSNKPSNRKQCIKSNQQNGQNNYLNNSTDNFYDMNGKSNYSQDHQDDEEDGSSMRRFDNNIPSLRQNGHYEESTIVPSIAPVSEYNSHPKRYYENNDGSIRKQFDNIQNQNRRQIQHHNVQKDEQFRSPIIRRNYIKKKNDEQFNNYGQSQIEPEGLTRYTDTTSNQNQLFYKNNNQKADNSSCNKNIRLYSVSRPSYSQNTNTFYDSDNNKYNSNSCSRLPNASSDLDKSIVAYNTYDQEKKTYYNKQPYLNKREPMIDDSSSNSNFDRSNFAQTSNSKSGNKPNKNRNFKQTRQYQKSAENTDLANSSYYNYNVGDSNPIPLQHSLMVTVSIQSELPQQFFHNQHHRQMNDGPVNYQRRLSHQSSSDGSNSQTSGNTSNTSYTNSSSISKNSQKNNYQQQNHQNQQNQQNPNKSNNNRKKKNHNNNMNGSGNGNSRLNNTANSSPVIALNYNDSSYQDVTFNAQSHMNQEQGHYGNEYNGNNDTNGYKGYNGSNSSYNSNYKSYNNPNNWKNSNGNGNYARTLNGSRNNNNNNNGGSKSVNNGNNFSSQSMNGNNSNNNYSRPNFNNNNGSYLRNQNNNVNSNKSFNGNNFKSLDGNNNSNLQTKNFNNNSYSGQTKNGQIYRKNIRKNTRNPIKVENKEDCVNHQQQYSQEERQNYHNIQSHQQKKVGQNGQNNNSGKVKGYKKNNYLKQNAEYQQQQ